jgi:SEC-C motif-containing protein
MTATLLSRPLGARISEDAGKSLPTPLSLSAFGGKRSALVGPRAHLRGAIIVPCACGLGENTETHCLPIIKGEKSAETAEALMRARYTAYALGEVDFIISTHTPEAGKDVDRDQTEAWSKNSKWLGLEVVATEGGGPKDDKGTVEFIARYKIKNVGIEHRERAKFEKIGGKWLFADAEQLAGPPVKHEGPRVGRNDPCTCGSGKKYKKCCGKAA